MHHHKLRIGQIRKFNKLLDNWIKTAKTDDHARTLARFKIKCRGQIGQTVLKG